MKPGRRPPPLVSAWRSRPIPAADHALWFLTSFPVPVRTVFDSSCLLLVRIGRLTGIMGDYFKPLRRKIGVVTLGIACLFVVGWVRSCGSNDWLRLVLREDKWSLSITSESGLAEVRFDETCWNCESEFDSTALRPGKTSYRWWTFKFFWRGADVGANGGIVIYALLPYWSIVTPLTLMSSWLLLSRPRAPKPVQPVAENA